MEEFKKKHTLEDRTKETSRLREKHAGHIPVYLSKSGKEGPDVKKHKYLVEGSKTMGEFMGILRGKHFEGKIDSIQALYYFAGNTLLGAGMLMDDIYARHKDKDGFLYIQYSTENTFGRT